MVVHETLSSYARRGVFRAYGSDPSAHGGSRFSFRWHTNVPMNLAYQPARRQLTFRGLLPAVGSRSTMYRELKQFLDARTSRAVPEHRRIDPRKAIVKLSHREGAVSLIVSLNPSHLEYGVRKAVNLVHEIFVDLLRRPMYFEYMVEHFELDPEG
jgi:hypothetical protein